MSVDLPLLGMQDGAMSSPATSISQEAKLYRIGEVARAADLKPFVLRYWETEFPMLQPVKTSRGHRLYRQEDVDLVLKIKRLLYDEGFTIAGARRHLRDLEHGGASESGGVDALAFDNLEAVVPQLNRKILLDLRDALRGFLTLLEPK